jgi:hypothetical protein
MNARRFTILLCVAVVGLASAAAQASVTMTVDSGPWYESNPAWFNAAKADTVSGTFTNLRTGTYPGTNYVDPVDFLNNSTVYTAGPKLLYWLYFIPNETVAHITANNLLQTKLVIDWGGDEYALAANHVNWVPNGDTRWLAAGAMEDYYIGETNMGVIGQIRFSWSLGSFGSTVEEYREGVLAVQTFARGEVRYRDSSSADWQYSGIQVNVLPTPEPTTIIVWGLLGVIGYGIYRRRRTG